MNDPWVALIVLFLMVVGICWWASGFSTRSRKTYQLYCQAVVEQRQKSCRAAGGDWLDDDAAVGPVSGRGRSTAGIRLFLAGRCTTGRCSRR